MATVLAVSGRRAVFGLMLLVAFGLARGNWESGAFLFFGLLFAHIVGVVPAAINAGLNIAVARAVRTRPLRLLAAPFCGAASAGVFLPFTDTTHERHWFVLATMALCAASSLICVAIHEYGRSPPALAD